MTNAFMEYPEETLARLNTDRDNGLSARQVEESRKANGENSFSKSEQKSLFRRIWEAATEPMLIMLVITLGVNVARYVTGGEADFLECIGIFVAISLSVVITVVMEGRSAKAFETLSRIGEDIPVKVIRDGKVCLIPRRDVVLGDILCVETGDKLPADGCLLESHEHIAVEAREIERLSDEELQKRIPSIRVIARSTPSVKMQVVNALKSLGNVVAVTGDGINDAPALKHADVGIAMGITGTEVSKEASDIVLLDDSFSTIVKAIQWGRGIYENFQRFIQFQLTVNLSSVIVVLASILAGFAAPFTALQLLWINIIMDGPPALTLGLEPIRGDLMNQRPTPRNASIVSGSMLSRIAINGVYMSIVFMAQHSLNFLGGSETELPTVLFTLFVVFQLFNALNSRELTDVSIFKNIANNRLMLGVFGATFGLQFVITQFGGMFFNTVPLSAAMWGKILATGSTVVLMSEGVKMVKRGAAVAQKSQCARRAHVLTSAMFHWRRLWAII